MQQGITLYHQLATMLATTIRRGDIPAGDRLPSEQELSQTYRVSPETVRRALAQLANDGLVEKRHGRGTFVLPPTTQEALRVAMPLESLFGLGDRFAAELISVEWREPPRGAKAALHLADGARVLEIVRRRTEATAPVSIAKNYLPSPLGEAVEPHLTTSGIQTLIKVVESHGQVRVDSAEEVIEATLADHDIAAQLQMPFGVVILAAFRTYFHGSTPLYFGEYYWRGDRFRIVATLQRRGRGNPEYVAGSAAIRLGTKERK